MAHWSVEVDGPTLARVVRALKRESDGAELSRDLVAQLRAVAEPALQATRSAIMAMPSRSEVLPGLRASVVRQTKMSVRTTGKRPGVSIYTRRAGMPRGFSNAPKHLNAARGWRHPVYGKARWVSQLGEPGWFDTTLRPFREPARRAAGSALEAAARRISERSR